VNRSRPPAVVRALAVLAASTLALGMAACGGDDDSGGSGTVTMWTFKRTHLAALQQAATQFKAKTGIDVKIEAYTPDDVFSSKVQAAAQTRDLPDVLELHSAGEDMRVGGGGLLSDLAGDFNDQALARFLPATRDSGRVTDQRKKQIEELKDAKVGSLYTVPFTAGAFGIVFGNREKMKAAGLNPDQPPKTWEEFLGYLQATTRVDAKQGGVSLGLKVPETGYNWLYQQLAFAYLGKERFQALFGKTPGQGFATPDGIRTLELYGQITPYWIPGVTALGIDDADVAFAQGKSAFDIGGTFTLAFLDQNNMRPDNLVTFPVPPPTGGKVSDLRLAPLALTGLGVTAPSKNHGSAVKWIDYLTSAEGAAVFAKGSLDLPATDLGAQAESLLGPKLAALQEYFTGPPENTYDAGQNTYLPPDFDAAEVSQPLQKLSPLKETSPAATATQLDAVVAAKWKSK
jgi:multiple sugar transport system substrate-binding protein